MGLALTLLHSPKLLILDEPTNGLDPAGIKQLRDILKEISRKEGIAVFVSSHILTEMELMCDKVSVINKGKIVKTKEIHKENKDEKSSEECEIIVKQLVEAENILRENEYETRISDNKIFVKTSHEKIPEITKLLVKNDIDIYNITHKEKSLEDIFFDAMENNGGQNNENN